MKDKEKFLEIMGDLFTVYGQPVNEQRLLAYWAHLKDDFADDEFEKAAKHILETEKFFPSLSAFYDYKRKINSLPWANAKKGVDY